MEYTEHQQNLLRKLEQMQKDEGLSLSALSARLGISKGAISQLFSGSYQRIRRRCLPSWKAISA